MAVAELHERFGPAFLMLHEDRRLGAEGKRSFGIRLPLAGVSSLSVLPAFASRSWTHEGPPRNIKVLTKFWDRGESTFLQENLDGIDVAIAREPVLEAPCPRGAVGVVAGEDHVDVQAAYSAWGLEQARLLPQEARMGEVGASRSSLMRSRGQAGYFQR